MAEAVKVEITDDTGKTTISSQPAKSAKQNKALNESAKENAKRNNASVIAKMVASRSISYATSNVGKWTGNTRNQNMVNTIKTGVAYGVSTLTNPVLGLTTMALDLSTTLFDYHYENTIDRYRVQQYNARIGGKGGYRK